jgi:hypothetical protein
MTHYAPPGGLDPEKVGKMIVMLLAAVIGLIMWVAVLTFR